MFFSISQVEQNNFPFNHKSKKFVINLDQGWNHALDSNGNDIWYKGYLDQGHLADQILNIIEETTPSYLGNFCAIRVTDQGVDIRSDRQRSFPIWAGKDIITNLSQQETTIWADNVITVTNNFNLKHNYFNVIGPVSNDINSYDSVLDQIDQILAAKTQSFLSNLTSPIKVFLSGGVDTALVFSYIQKYTSNYELVNYLHCDFDYFYLKNHGTLSELWGYNQIHHWNEPCVLASGAPGDEFMGRSPTTANLLLLHYKTSIPELLSTEYADCLHSLYFSRPEYLKLWEGQSIDTTHLAEIVKTCANYNVNDWQHWHFGNTLTWTPLRDIEIFKLVASLPLSELKEQVMNSKLSLDLIRRNNPKILSYLSDKKNSANYFENLTKVYNK